MRLGEHGLWDPDEEYWGEPDEPIPEYARPIIDRGPRTLYEMEQVLPGVDPDDLDDPIIDGKLWPVEIKHAATVRREWATPFTALDRLKKPIGAGAVVCLTPDDVPVGRRLTALPVGTV